MLYTVPLMALALLATAYFFGRGYLVQTTR
jgi:hypothetical protein